MPTPKLAVIALMSVAASADAGRSASIHFEADRLFAFNGEPVTWTAMVSFDGFSDPTAYVGGYVGDVFLASGSADYVSFTNLMNGLGVPPAISTHGVSGINVFNAALLGTNVPGNPLAAFQVVTAHSDGQIMEMTADGLVSIFENDGVFTRPIEFESFTVTSDLVNAPTPGALGLLGIGCLAVRRRR